MGVTTKGTKCQVQVVRRSTIVVRTSPGSLPPLAFSDSSEADQIVPALLNAFLNQFKVFLPEVLESTLNLQVVLYRCRVWNIVNLVARAVFDFKKWEDSRLDCQPRQLDR